MDSSAKPALAPARSANGPAYSYNMVTAAADRHTRLDNGLVIALIRHGPRCHHDRIATALFRRDQDFGASGVGGANDGAQIGEALRSR